MSNNEVGLSFHKRLVVFSATLSDLVNREPKAKDLEGEEPTPGFYYYRGHLAFQNKRV
jgi:hypothetical protein